MKYFYGTILFLAGVMVGWLNPIEGPLDWTYDEYASQPAHKSPVKAAPVTKEKPEFIWWFDEEEEIVLPEIIQAAQED